LKPRAFKDLIEGIGVATQPAKRRGPASPAARKFVMASVKLDVATHARVAAAAALAGIDRSAWIAKAINEGLTGIVVFDRRAPKGSGADDGDTVMDRQDEAAA